MSREKTLEEMQKEFLNYIHGLVDYWYKESRTPDNREKLEGLAHSILTAIDGMTFGLPAYTLIPIMAEGDKEFYMSQDENYYPTDVDIAGNLNDLFFNYKWLKGKSE